MRAYPHVLFCHRPWDPVRLYGERLLLDFDASEPNVLLDPEGRVTDWLDRSPRGEDATQATEDARFGWVESDPDFGNRSVLVGSGAQYADTGSWASIPQPITILGVASRSDTTPGFVWDSQGASPLALMTSSQDYWLDGGSQLDSGYGSATYGINGATPPAVRRVSEDVNLVEVEYAGNASTLSVNGALEVTGAGGANGSTAMRIGARRILSLFWSGRIARVVMIQGLRTAKEKARDAAALLTRYLPGQLLGDGDSIMLGRFAVPLPGADPIWAARGSGIVNAPFAVKNVAVGGQRGDQVLAQAPTSLDPARNARRPWQVVAWSCGANDFFFGQSAEFVYEQLVQYAVGRAALGFGVIAWTMTKWTSMTPQALAFYTALRGYVLENPSAAPYTPCDMAEDPRLSDPADLQYFIDGIHSTTEGSAVRGEVLARTLARKLGLLAL